jgi:hypothetical protein
VAAACNRGADAASGATTALAQGKRRSGSLYIAADGAPAVITTQIAQQLIAIGFARLDRKATRRRAIAASAMIRIS